MAENEPKFDLEAVKRMQEENEKRKRRKEAKKDKWVRLESRPITESLNLDESDKLRRERKRKPKGHRNVPGGTHYTHSSGPEKPGENLD